MIGAMIQISITFSLEYKMMVLWVGVLQYNTRTITTHGIALILICHTTGGWVRSGSCSQ